MLRIRLWPIAVAAASLIVSQTACAQEMSELVRALVEFAVRHDATRLGHDRCSVIRTRPGE